MGMTFKLPDWSLNYQVAAFGAYATILVESVYVILGGFENASLLSTSILTNGSAVFVVGFGGTFSTPFAIIRICLTSLFLLWAIISQENGAFDGTYAILCSVAHLFYQLRLRQNWDESEGFLPQYEKCAKTDEAPSESCLHTPPMDHNDAAKLSRNLRIFFGDSFCLEGAMVPVTVLGTVMTYRVFDFDLGFGLVFAFLSAFSSSVILLFINYARTRGRRMDTRKALQRLLAMVLVIGSFCFVFFTSVEFPGIEFNWWKITFGVAWFMFLFITTFVACRFLIHATLFSCAACSQREAGIYGPLTQEASARCLWDDSVTLPALDQVKDDAIGESTTFRIKRQKGPDLVERFWLGDQEWFQISPRSFVIFFVSCIALASFSGGALGLNGSFADIGSQVSKNTAFYVTMVFTFVSTGHTPVGDSPELMFVPLRHYFPAWKAIASAILATMLVHAYLVLAPLSEVDSSFATPLACTVVAPLLLAGLSKPLDTVGQAGNRGPGLKEQTVNLGSAEPSMSTIKTWAIDSTLVYSSSHIRRLDLRVLLLGVSVTLFDVLCNQYQDEMSVTRWPTSAVVSIIVTGIWLYLNNSVPTSRELEPGLLSLAAASLVGIFSHVNFLDAFGLYDNEWENKNSTQIMPRPEKASHSNPVMIALWYTTLISMVVFNRRLVHRKADQALPATNGQPPKRDHLLFGLHVKTSRTSFAWQLRDSRVAICLVFTMVAACMGESWPLDMNTTVAGLLLFTLIVSFQLPPTSDNLDEKKSMLHVAALGFSALVTVLAVGLNRHRASDDLMSDPKLYWKAGAWSALIFYRLFVMIVGSLLEGRGWFTRRNHVGELPTVDGARRREAGNHRCDCQ
ncbi:hypothetical protein HO173_006788 [Letharia columbiana]|uniref:Transmembrane protein n=1 Tax=Letharia columbiana TaxID=112416 RepID=A0A8H6FUR7_9LECA|nr:uncharacterized protein HO173_006788 [Letharia columbiana]KAF6235159.1 hypothetical protein HO173_006788 [Letharia columbiana]